MSYPHFGAPTVRATPRAIPTLHGSQRLVNHITLVLDGSYSMGPHVQRVIEVTDGLIRDLALESEKRGQETRVTIYVFDSTVRCLIFDMDVMRLPSIRDLYTVNGNTALRDGFMFSQHDLATTSQIYGEHAFLTYVATDGDDNARNQQFGIREIAEHLAGRSQIAQALGNYSVAWLVPDSVGRAFVERLGAPSANVKEWDTTSATGMVDVGRDITASAVNFMAGREHGVHTSRSVFSTGADAVNDATIGQALATGALTPMAQGTYVLLPVQGRERIDEFVGRSGLTYVKGNGFYQLNKTENIQPQKRIIAVRKATGEAFADPTSTMIGGVTVGSPAVRQMIGLSNRHEKVRPNLNPEYEIYVQSTADNRNLIPGQRLLFLTAALVPAV